MLSSTESFPVLVRALDPGCLNEPNPGNKFASGRKFHVLVSPRFLTFCYLRTVTDIRPGPDSHADMPFRMAAYLHVCPNRILVY
jgi:hypothetical protein